METEFINVLITVIELDTNTPNVLAAPYWEIDRATLPERINSAIMEFCHAHGTGAFAVTVSEINL